PPPPTRIYTLSLHDALPISPEDGGILAAEHPAAARERGGERNRTAFPSQGTYTAASHPTESPRGTATTRLAPQTDHRAESYRHQDRKSTRLNSSHLVISYAV